MAATLAWRGNLYVPPAWCAICAIFPTRPKSFRPKSPRTLRWFAAQGFEAGGIGVVARPARHSLHMLDLGRRAGEEKECPARGGIVAPHLRRPILAGEGRRTRQGAQLRGLESREGIRLVHRRRRRDRHGRRRGRALGRGAAGECQNKQGDDALLHVFALLPAARWNRCTISAVPNKGAIRSIPGIMLASAIKVPDAHITPLLRSRRR